MSYEDGYPKHRSIEDSLSENKGCGLPSESEANAKEIETVDLKIYSWEMVEGKGMRKAIVYEQDEEDYVLIYNLQDSASAPLIGSLARIFARSLRGDFERQSVPLYIFQRVADSARDAVKSRDTSEDPEKQLQTPADHDFQIDMYALVDYLGF